MPAPFDSAALYAAGSCGCHQQVYGFMPDAGGLPAGATGYIDFQTRTFYFVGGSTDFEDVVFADLDNYGTAFDPATDVTAAGLIEGACSLTGDALDLMLPGGATCVAVVDLKLSTSGASPKLGSGFVFDMFNAPNFVLDWKWIALCAEDGIAGQGNLMRAGGVDYLYADEFLAEGVHKLGVTFETSKIAMCIDGGTVSSQLSVEAWAGKTPDSFAMDVTGLNSVVPDISGAGLQKFIIYPAKYGADLQAVTAL